MITTHSFLLWIEQLMGSQKRSPGRRKPFRKVRPLLEGLEDRLTPNGLTPAQIRTAYGINSITNFGSTPANGAGQTIAVVDFSNDPNIISDLAQFDTLESVPAPPSFQIFNETGTNITSLIGNGGGMAGVPTNATAAAQWGDEISLDVEWAHSIAPGAAIDLVECSSNLYTGAATAATLPGVSVVSMSFFAGTGGQDSVFNVSGVTFLACSGDNGAPGWYPAYSPNVIAVGGTGLTVDSSGTVSNGSYESETGWVGSGGGAGPSSPDTEPTYQDAAQSTGQRTIPDVAFDGDFNFSPVAIYDSYDSPGNPQFSYGGTSLGSPCWAGLIAIANQGRVAAGGSVFNTGSGNNQQALSAIYNLPSSDFHDITTGNNIQVTQVTMNMEGTGYTAPTVTFSPPPAGTTATGTVVTANGQIVGVNITNAGTGYTSPPTVSFGGGTGAIGTATVSSGSVTGVNISNGGSGYLSVAFTGGGGSGATGQPIVSGGQITGVTITTGKGAGGYTSPPTVVFTGGGGTGASGTASTAGFTAGPGYDEVTGLGTPIANLLIPDLAGQSANLVYTAPANVLDHNMVVEQSGANIDIYDNSVLVATHPAATTSQIEISGGDAMGTISLTVDYSGGAFTSIPVTYDGGAGPGSHSLTIQGGNFFNETYTPIESNSGEFFYNNSATASISFSDLQPVTDTSNAGTFTITDSTSSDTINIENGAGDTTEVSSSGGNFESVSFANKTIVIVKDLAGGDLFNVDANAAASTSGFGILDLVDSGTSGDTFSVITLDGVTLGITGSGSSGNTLEGPAQVESWYITGTNSGYIMGLVTLFTDIQNLTGGGDQDTFQFLGSGTLAGTINGNGPDATILGPNATAVWSINMANEGSIGTSGDLTGVLDEFEAVENLTGGFGADTFIVGPSGSLSGTLDGGGGNNTIDGPTLPADTDTWDITGFDSGNSGTISPTYTDIINSFMEIQNLVGGNNLDDFVFSPFASMGTITGGSGTTTIVGPAQSNLWRITGANTGSIPGVLGSFTTAPTTATLNLTAGGVQDTFLFLVGGTLNGTIDGTAAGINTTTIDGPNANTFWSITGMYSGFIGTTPGASDILTMFMNVGNLMGGTMNDTFTVSTGGEMGTVNGGGGNNTIDGPSVVDTWDITGFDMGNSGTNAAANNIIGSFMEIQNLVGGNNTDTFIFSVFASMGTINGGAGVTNIIGAAQPNLWHITGPNTGSIQNVLTSFTTTPTSATLNLTGGGVQDTFVFSVGGSLNGTINGTAAGINTTTIDGPNATTYWSITGPYSGKIGTTLGASDVLKAFVNVGNLMGGNLNDTFTFSVGGFMGAINGGSGITTIHAAAQNNYWDINGTNSGTILGVLNSFMSPGNATLNLMGGGFSDTYTFGYFSSLNGTIDGTGGTNGFAVIIGPNANTSWYITGPNSGSIGYRLLAFKDVPYLLGGYEDDMFIFGPGGSLTGDINGGYGDNTVVGPNTNIQWWVTGPNAGTLGYGNYFLNIENLAGGAGQDVFNFLPGGYLTGGINGGGGENWLDYGSLDYIVYVDLAVGVATDIVGGVVNVQSVIGSAVGDNCLIGGAAGGVLVAHGAGNTVIGGGGPSVLIGGYGKNLIEAGGSDDLIIAGSTIYDYNVTALTAILAEWQSPLSYAGRIYQLKYGGGLNGAYVLDLNYTVFVPSTPPGPRFGYGGGEFQTTIIGNAAQDWFFTDYSTTILYLQPDEQVD